MGNCIYKIQIDQKAQTHDQIEQKIVDEVIKDEIIQTPPLIEPKKILTQNYEVVVQENSDSQTPNVFSSQSSNPQVKYQQDLQLSPDILVRNQKEGEMFSLHYEIIRKLGQGGFGSVYQVKHLKTNLIRAAKVIQKQAIDDEQLLISESQILKDLDHPNIVKILEVFSDAQNIYIITECLCGGELLERVRSITNYNEDIAKYYMQQILSAMVYCHNRKIVHRDLKPENILFDDKDINSNLKIIDFGASEKIISKKLTTKIGTPYFLAPEILGSNGYDEKVDVWSCGVILYILLIGKAPFRGKNQLETLQLAQKAHLSFSGQRWNNISPEAIDLVKHMIQKDPQKRISMKDALNHKWIQNQSKQSIQFDQDFFKEITKFKGYNNLRVAINQFVTVQISKKEEKYKFLQIFKSLDKNGDGLLSQQEILQGMINVKMDKIESKLMVKEIMEKIDTDHSGRVDFTEFLTASIIQEQMFLKESLKSAFRLFDLDGNGTISRIELEEIFGGIQIDNSAWQDILAACDNNKDGLIEEDEFIALLANLE
ncbi:unnamed protein product (macronuclear) [Paramecium tetraurelia]|uniref:non-specific serine/threonine protein kinase n=1 Tax=Paramecium tetraurelia TaxID=5888 RepID=A0CKX5_PARTE|nr:uncharacterized protein GSPATT00007989001 [Paramecium tetraurelia]CAK71442.1 unnamed protein product [Paramecium tetraurelia]|eukprot:XP_001438839.1 hypothetical protein (macronuclear) [Paramecium tetraurelia strain d4-2]